MGQGPRNRDVNRRAGVMTSSEDPMFSAAVRAFLQRPLHAALATTDPITSRISQSVVWYHLDEESPGQPTVWLSCAPDSVKARHVAANPDVSLLVMAPHGGAYVRISGSVTVEHLSHDQRRQLIAPYRGPETDLWLTDHPLPRPNLLLRIHPDRVVARGIS